VRVYIVRHGETQENRDGIIQGQQDTALNAVGLEQARMVGEALKDAKLGVAFSSDLSRALKVRGSNQTRSIQSHPFFRMRFVGFVPLIIVS
jgi:probable phosphoglycerate mutase